MSDNKFLEKKFNVAAVRVSTNNQDCDRQKETLANLGHNLGIKYDLWLEDKGQKRGCIERDSFKKLEEISFSHPNGFNLWYSDATRFGTYELWEKQKNEFFIPHKISIFTPQMLWDMCFPETITERVMTTCLFALATEELEALSKRIKGKHETMAKAGLYTAANVPWLCDVRREDLAGNHIFTWRETVSRMKARKLGEKIRHIMIMPDGEIRNENPPRHDKTKDIQRLCLTGDKERIEIIWHIYKWCLKQKKLGIGYTWNQLANELTERFEDTYGCGWNSGRCRDLITNPACIGLPILGKTTRPKAPTMFFRNKEEADGFERNRAFRSGNCRSDDVPESNYVQPDKPLFDLLPVEEWKDLREHILSLETGQIENIKEVNKVREKQGLRKLCRPLHERKKPYWLNDFIWDDVHNCQFVSSGKQINCIVRAQNDRYKKNRTDMCKSFKVSTLTCIVNDYFRLPFWRDYDLMNYKTEIALSMQELIDEFAAKDDGDFEELYSLSLERANAVVTKEIKEIDEQLFNMYRFIGKENLPTLKQKALELETQKMELEKSIKSNLLPTYQLERKNIHFLEESLTRLQKGAATEEDLQLIMNKMNIRMHINCNDLDKYIQICSTMIDAKLEISEADYQKYYRARFFPWAKGKEFDYLEGKFYDGSAETKKKNQCPSMVARFEGRKKRQNDTKAG